IIKILGRGVCGPVYLAKRMDGPIEYYAIKIIYKNQPDTIRRNNTMSNELSLHQKLHHDNIIKLKFSIELNEEQILMALEYCDGGDLYDHLTQPNYFYPKDWILFNLSIKTQFLDILKAVQYCHLNGIYHRDIKPENILLTSKNEIKLADFGLSTNFPYSQQYNCGSGYYMAPEIQQQNQIYKHYPKYNCIQADKWSLGILFLNLCCGKNPWESANYNDINFIEFVHNPNFLLHLFPLSKLGLKIALSLLKINPDSRIELDNLIQLVENTNIFV
ncbi:kinase-like protein, partial [Neoconidiobolus thromboides FSU 785]